MSGWSNRVRLEALSLYRRGLSAAGVAAELKLRHGDSPTTPTICRWLRGAGGCRSRSDAALAGCGRRYRRDYRQLELAASDLRNLNATEVANALGVHPSTVRKWRERRAKAGAER